MKEKLLYFHTGKSSFVAKDLEILGEAFAVSDFRFNTHNKKKIILELVRQKLFLLRHVFSSKLMVCQFSGHQSFLPVLFSRLFFKKCVIIAGGTDCVSFPSIRYGNFQNPLLAFTTAFSFRHCHLILPVHDTLIGYDYTYQPNDYPKQGISFFVKNIRTPMKTIFNGYDSSKWFCAEAKEEKSFITIGADLGSRFGFALKGIDLIFDIAGRFKDCTFYIIGGKQIDRPIPSNVKLLDNVPNQELRPLLGRMRFYLQLSMSEGFPNALSEAMLCECIPIVSAAGGMPDIVSGTGYILKHKNLDELGGLIASALAAPGKDLLGRRAHEKIAADYPLEKRKKLLLYEISQLIHR